MQIKIKNLGAVKTADIDLKPLTVFVGDNGTGKTWTAYTIAALLGSYGYRHYLETYQEGKTEFKYKEIEAAISQLIDTGNTKINLTDFVDKNIEIYLNEIARIIPGKLNKYLATKRVFFEETSLAVKFSAKEKKALEKQIKDIPVDNMLRIGTKKQESSLLLKILKEKNMDELYYYMTFETTNEHAIQPEIIAKEVREFLISRTFMIMRRAILGNVPILPTERTTYITFPFYHEDTQKEATLYKNSEEKDMIAQISVPIQFFLAMIGKTHEIYYKQDRENSDDPFIKKYIALADILETDILSGRINLEKVTDQTEIIYNIADNVKLELNIASSMVKELAPLALYLRYLAEPPDLLIIDEPEMNLHPEAQVKMTEFLCMLVKAGLNVLITTHSPYILDHLNNLILAGKSNNQDKLTEYFYLENKEAFIPVDDVAVYLFNENTAQNILDDAGIIDWKTFGDVSSDVMRIYQCVAEQDTEQE